MQIYSLKILNVGTFPILDRENYRQQSPNHKNLNQFLTQENMKFIQIGTLLNNS